MTSRFSALCQSTGLLALSVAQLLTGNSYAADIRTLNLKDISATPAKSQPKSLAKTPAPNVTQLTSQLNNIAGTGVQLIPLMPLNQQKPQSTSGKNTAKPALQHQRYQQTFYGLPVWGQQIAVHSHALTMSMGSVGLGSVAKLNGSIAQNIAADLPTPASLKAQYQPVQILDKAKKYHTEQLKHITSELTAEQINYSQINIELMVYIDQQNTAKLAYFAEFFYTTPQGQAGKPSFIIDAQNNTVLQHWDGLLRYNATGPGGNDKTGHYEYGVDKPFLNVSENDGRCTMENDAVKTVNLDHQWPADDDVAHSFDCPRNVRKAINGASSPLNDAHAFAQVVHNMYQDWYSITPLNSKIVVKTHYREDAAWAFYSDGAVVLGDGDQYTHPQGVLDVISHEVAHGFTEQHSNLIYQHQPGAIHEAFSAIAGEAAEFYLNGSSDWLEGADTFKSPGAEGYFADPAIDQGSISHADDYSSHLNPHYSAGVFKKAFYLLANTAGWDIRQAFNVYVDANRHYWTRYSDFTDGACGVINAADDRQYNVYDVYSSFAQVGVYCDNHTLLDQDGDGLDDFWEIRYHLDNTNADDATLDSDNDGLNNLQEYAAGTSPNLSDTDGDNLSDSNELNHHGTNPLLNDTDGDQLPDGWEVSQGFNPLVAAVADIDSDGDGFSDLGEFKTGSLANDANSVPVVYQHYSESFEGSTLPDIFTLSNNGPGNQPGWQLTTQANSHRSQSLTALSSAGDATAALQWTGYFAEGQLHFDHKTSWFLTGLRMLEIDGQQHWVESTNTWGAATFDLAPGLHTIRWLHRSGIGPGQSWIDNISFFAKDADIDNDRMADRWEAEHGLDHNNSNDAMLDPDGDGLTNQAEYFAGTDPHQADTDGDGLTDGDEINLHHTDPLNNDSDYDGMSDGYEFEQGLDPHNRQDNNEDADGDGFTNYQEYSASTQANDANSQPVPIARLFETFDDGVLPSYLTTPDDSVGSWSVTNQHSQSGDFSLAATPVEPGSFTIIELSGYFNAGTLSFDYKIDPSSGDRLILEHPQFFARQASDWQHHQTTVDAGFQTFRLKYYAASPRLIQNPATQTGWIDNLLFIENNYDGDQDGINDQWEYDNGLDFNNAADAAFDPDNDGLSNQIEASLGTNIHHHDSDGDGLSDFDEVNIYHSSPTDDDSDNDGMPDGWEISFNMNPNVASANDDTDGDGIADFDEYQIDHLPTQLGTTDNPLDWLFENFDNAIQPHWLVAANGQWQISHNLGHNNSKGLTTTPTTVGETVVLTLTAYFDNGTLSFDGKAGGDHRNKLRFFVDEGHYEVAELSGGEGWQTVTTNLWGKQTLKWTFEVNDINTQTGMDLGFIDNLLFTKGNIDNDHDGMPDRWEFEQGLDLTAANNANLDPDDDGLTNLEEYRAGSDAHNKDSDNDGLLDGIEVHTYGTKPNRSDSDNDGMPDNWEIRYGLDPLTRIEGLDTDEDGFSDVAEYLAGTLPLDASSTPESVVIPQPIEFVAEYFNNDLMPTFLTSPAESTGVWTVSEGSLNATVQHEDDIAIIQWTGHFAAGKLNFKNKNELTGITEFCGPQAYSDDRCYYLADPNNNSWTQYTFNIPAGEHTLSLRYSQNNNFEDIKGPSLIDDLIFIANGYDGDADGLPDQWEYDNGLDFNQAIDAEQDRDGDGLSNLTEYTLGTDIDDIDSDDDGLSDNDEVNTYGTNPLRQDSDADGMPDVWEITHQLLPTNSSANNDADNDGFSDHQEYQLGTNPNDSRSVPVTFSSTHETFENATIPTFLQQPENTNNRWIISDNTGANSSHSLVTDITANDKETIIQWHGVFTRGQLYFDYKTDTEENNSLKFKIGTGNHTLAHGKNDWQRYQGTIHGGVRKLQWTFYQHTLSHGTIWIDNLTYIPDNTDADNDGLQDQWEFENGLDIRNPDDAQEDADNDGLSNLAEIHGSSDWQNPDSDGDGLSDGDEVNIYGTQPSNSDSDNDGIPDAWEIEHGLDPLVFGRNHDTDGDGIDDYSEYSSGTNPNDATSLPQIISSVFETFDSGSVPAFLTNSDNADNRWVINHSQSESGNATYSLSATTNAPNQLIEISWQGYFSSGQFGFAGKVGANEASSLSFMIDGTSQNSVPQAQDWQRKRWQITEGYHTLKLVYQRNRYNNSTDTNMAWIDSLAFMSDQQDIDNDGLSDQWEFDQGLDFTNPADAAFDGDGDGLSTLEEYTLGTDINQADTDGDGLSDGFEVNEVGTNPNDTDTDSDLVPDGWELDNQMDPTLADNHHDNDNDGFINLDEYRYGSSPNDASDRPTVTEQVWYTFESGQLPQQWVTPGNAPDHGSDNTPDHTSAPWQLTTQDSHNGQSSLTTTRTTRDNKIIVQWTGLFVDGTVGFAYKLNTRDDNRFNFYIDNGSKHLYDSGVKPWQIVTFDLSAGVHTLTWEYDRTQLPGVDIDQVWLDDVVFIKHDADGDNDSLPDLWEYTQGLDFTDATDAGADSDNDGLSNLAEYGTNTAINNPDSDNDGLSDGEEVNLYGTNPLKADSDDDQMADNWEVAYGLDPLNYSKDHDTDGDGLSDHEELMTLSNPTDSQDKAEQISLFVNDFENQQLPLSWSNSSLGWTVKAVQNHTSRFALVSQPIKGGEIAQIVWPGQFAQGRLSFDYKQVGADKDRFRFSSSAGAQNLGSRQWQQVSFDILSGEQTLSWSLQNTDQAATAQSQVMIDNLVFIATGRDNDNDGMEDLWEFDHGLDYTNPSDANGDADNDGLTNLQEFVAQLDPTHIDTDRDGVADFTDDLPLNTHEWLDTDGDGIGNNEDTDDDGDGILDVDEIPDSDGDGFNDDEDAFPADPTEWLDTDGDGIGNNADSDDDNDGASDNEELAAGSNPLDANSLPSANDTHMYWMQLLLPKGN